MACIICNNDSQIEPSMVDSKIQICVDCVDTQVKRNEIRKRAEAIEMRLADKDRG